MLSKLVVDIYTDLIEVCLWLLLIIGFVIGWQLYGVIGGLGGLLVSALFGSLSFGAFLVFNDIRAEVIRVRETLTKMENQLYHFSK